MKKSEESILFLTRENETVEKYREMKSNWSRKITSFCRADWDEILSTFSIPLLVLFLSLLMTYYAHGQETGRISQFFESVEEGGISNSETVAPVQPQYTAQTQMVPAQTQMVPAQTQMVPVQTQMVPVQTQMVPVQTQPTRQRDENDGLRTYRLASGGVVREYRQDGMLIRETDWGTQSNTNQPVQQPVAAQPYVQPVQQMVQQMVQQPVQQPVQQVVQQPIQQPVQQVVQQPVPQPISPQIATQPVVQSSQPVSVQPVEQPAEIAQATAQPVTSTPITVPATQPEETAISMELPSDEALTLPDSITPVKEPVSAESQNVVKNEESKEIKKWEQVGLIPQSWSESSVPETSVDEFELPSVSEVAQSTALPEELAQNTIPALENDEILPNPVMETPRESVEVPVVGNVNVPVQTTVAETTVAETAVAETEMEVLPVPETSSVLDVKNSSNAQMEFNEKAFDAAIADLQEPSGSMGKFQALDCIEGDELEKNWEEPAISDEIQQVSHLEYVAPTGKEAATVQKSAKNMNVKHLAGPRSTAHRLEKKPGKTGRVHDSRHFAINVSTQELEELISTKEETQKTPTQDLELNTQLDAVSDASESMRKPVSLPEVNQIVVKNSDQETSMTHPETELFDFGIEDCAIFNMEQDDSFPEETQSTETTSEAPSASVSMNSVISPEEEFVSPSESVSTITTIYTENCCDSRIRLVSYEESVPNRKAEKKDSEEAEEEEEEGDVELDFLLLPPEEFEAKSFTEMKEEARELLPPLPTDSKQETIAKESTEENGVPEMNLPEMPKEEDSAQQSSEIPETINIDEAEELPVVLNPAQSSELGLNEESGLNESSSPAEATDLNNESGLNSSEAPQNTEVSTVPQSNEQNAGAEFQPSQKTEEFSSQVAEQIADRIVNQVTEKVIEQTVNRTVEEVLKRLKEQMDAEVENRLKIAESQEKVEVPEESIGRNGISNQLELTDDSCTSDEFVEITGSKQNLAQHSGKDSEVAEPAVNHAEKEVPVQQAVSQPVKLHAPKRPQSVTSEEIAQVEEVESLDSLSNADSPKPTETSAIPVTHNEAPQVAETSKNHVKEPAVQQKEAPGFVKISSRKRKNRTSETIPAPSVEQVQNEQVQNEQVQNEQVQTETAQNEQVQTETAQNEESQTKEVTEEAVVDSPKEKQELVQESVPEAISVPSVSAVSAKAELPVKTLGSPKVPQISAESLMVHSSEKQGQTETEKGEFQRFRSSDPMLPEKPLYLQPCVGLVMNTNSEIQSISVEDSQYCDTVQLSNTRIALIGKCPGETQVRVVFVDSSIRTMVLKVKVQGGTPDTKFLAEWAYELETQLSSAANASLSVFQFQNRIFVKGVIAENVDPIRIMSAVQKDFVRLRKENPTLNIPGFNKENRKIVLVNMMQKQD